MASLTGGLRIIVPNSFIGLGYSYVLIEEHFQMEYVSIVTLVYMQFSCG